MKPPSFAFFASRVRFSASRVLCGAFCGRKGVLPERLVVQSGGQGGFDLKL